KWSEPLALTGAKESIARCAIAAEGNGEVWVAYSALRNGQHHIYARPVSKKYSKTNEPEAGTEIKVNQGNGPCLAPAMGTDQKGRVHIAFASAAGEFGTQIVTIDKGKLQGKRHNLTSMANQWGHTLTAAPDGGYAVAYDEYQGDYDVSVEFIDKNNDYQNGKPVATTARFQARPPAVYGDNGRTWTASQEAPRDL